MRFGTSNTGIWFTQDLEEACELVLEEKFRGFAEFYFDLSIEGAGKNRVVYTCRIKGAAFVY